MRRIDITDFARSIELWFVKIRVIGGKEIRLITSRFKD